MRTRAAVVAGLCLLIGLVLVWPRAWADPPQGRDVPPEVIANTVVARQNMGQILRAIVLYHNAFPEAPLPALSYLYPQWISDPLVFWHPGDPDPPPTTIDNDEPNAPNSSRISFDLDVALVWEYCPGEQPLVRDNSHANNGGLFVNVLYNDGLWYAEPLGVLPAPTATLVARVHLRRLALGLMSYSSDNSGWWPDRMLSYLPYVGPPCVPARVFWHPGDDQPMPTQITSDVPDAPESAQVSFTYLLAGLNENDYDPDLPCFRDNSPANNGGCGSFVALLDGRVLFEPLCDGDLNVDGVVDVADLDRLTAHLGQHGEVCDGDFDFNGAVLLDDFAQLQRRSGATCE